MTAARPLSPRRIELRPVSCLLPLEAHACTCCESSECDSGMVTVSRRAGRWPDQVAGQMAARRPRCSQSRARYIRETAQSVVENLLTLRIMDGLWHRASRGRRGALRTGHLLLPDLHRASSPERKHLVSIRRPIALRGRRTGLSLTRFFSSVNAAWDFVWPAGGDWVMITAGRRG